MERGAVEWGPSLMRTLPDRLYIYICIPLEKREGGLYNTLTSQHWTCSGIPLGKEGGPITTGGALFHW